MRPRPAGGEWARRTCDAIMKRSPVLTDRWHYDVGLVLSGFESVWRKTGDRRYLDYVKANVDRLVGPGRRHQRVRAAGLHPRRRQHGQGAVRAARGGEGRGRPGTLSRGAARRCARSSPRSRARPTAASGTSRSTRTRCGPTASTWPRRSWPSSRRCSASRRRSTTRSSRCCSPRRTCATRRPACCFTAGTRARRSAGRIRATGLSSQLWGRGVGWYAMAVVDVLAEMPRRIIRSAARSSAFCGGSRARSRASRTRRPASGGRCWTRRTAAATIREASASAMFVYALAKGVTTAGWTRRRSRPSPRAAMPGS